MATIIKIKRGLKANLPTLSIGELGYCLDTNEMFIGTSGGNVQINPETDLSNYYTQSQIDTLLAGKLDISTFTGHTHAESDITNLDKYTQSEVDGKLLLKVDKSVYDAHTHTEAQITDLDKYTQGQIDTMLLVKADLVDGKIPTSQLPSFVDDVIEYTNLAGFPATGETGKIYVAKDTNKAYRWSGSSYVEISASLALGETSSTAYRGDRGKTAYDHSQILSGNPHGVTLEMLGGQPSGTYNGIIGTDLDINASGATVISTLIMTDGVITSHSTRTMTLNDLGFIGDNNANYYIHPIYSENDINTAGAQVIDTVTIVNGHINGFTYRNLTLADLGFVGDNDANKYVHPDYTETDIDTNGAEVIDTITIVNGHVNGHTKRTLTLADLGYTGASNANYYVHPTYAGDDIDVDTGALSGSAVISDLDFNVTTDTQGHVTDANGTKATRNLDAVRGQHGVDVKFHKLTQSQYDALGTKDANTLYIIVG